MAAGYEAAAGDDVRQPLQEKGGEVQEEEEEEEVEGTVCVESESVDEEAGASREILRKVQALVSAAHATCPYRPTAVATSAVLGWGHETLLLSLEEKLAEAGLLRGKSASPRWV